ncbi:hypothetical protein GCM10027575_15640 [Phytohabitans suffuscus]
MPAQTAEQTDRELLRKDCWANARHAYGTSFIFQRRARRLRRSLHLVSYAGIALPLIVGSVALSFGTEFKFWPILIVVVASLLIGQLAVSLWSAMGGWLEKHAYASESASANDRLARRYEELGRNPPAGAQFKIQYDLLGVDDENRRDQDTRQEITAKERRYGMRVALHRFDAVCTTCDEKPKSLKPTDCDTCGNF